MEAEKEVVEEAAHIDSLCHTKSKPSTTQTTTIGFSLIVLSANATTICAGIVSTSITIISNTKVGMGRRRGRRRRRRLRLSSYQWT